MYHKSDVLIQEAIYLRHEGKLKDAVAVFQTALELVKEGDKDAKWLATKYNYYADLLFESEDLAAAEVAIEKAVNYSRQAEFKYALGDSLLIHSRIRKSLHDKQSANRLAREAQTVYLEIGHQHGVEQVELLLADL